MVAIESLSGIATFVAVARASSFTQAGELLGVSKSAVGKAVSRLEERLGVKLFHRTTRRLALTADGEAYFTVCARALEGISEAEGNLGTRLMEPAGRLRIDMPAAFGRKVMLPILLDIGKAYPALQLTLTFTDHVIDLVEEGVDLSIRFGTIEDSSDLVARKLTSHRWVICATPAYLRKTGKPRTLADIAAHRCIVGYRRGRPLSWHITEDGKATRFAPPPTYQIGDGEAMVDAALAGMGLCQMPIALFRQYIESRRLVTVLDTYTAHEIDVHAVWPRTAHLRPKVRHVVDRLMELARQGRLN
ncbi:DNA-binding transcriptional regulator, LysR family [Collimonas sp. OK607]|uniref:LysR family transcriptional regulator n=1 Tax=Collimonas sp. OK607 TaxID=1798194 RepID=UPI0008F1AB4E|nr:LysR family transcriptional regulator [Collimonas sp. OK607]SFB21105.1 DNA-binding transcriptional regulator, LysR family [Collimonas sp. OK607]